MVQQNFYLGTSGFNYDDWKVIFYPKTLPQSKWLAFYAQHYNTVEINATFYRYFARSVFTRWRDTTPESFRFTLKGPKKITHEKRLQAAEEDLSRFFDSIQDLNSKLAAVLWQLPPSFKYGSDEDFGVVSQFMEQLPKTLRHVIEFRHASWFRDDVYALLNQHQAGFVINDSNRFPAAEVITGHVAYIRFHGPEQLYASSYSSEALQRWANKIHMWLTDSDVYAYFNNDYGGRAIADSVALRQFVTESKEHDR